MLNLKVDKSKFKFQYMPDFADFILKNKLEEFVTVGIRFCREMDLPLMRPLAKIPEKDLIAMSKDSNEELLKALAENDVTPLIEKRLELFIKNEMTNKQGQKVLDRSEILAEDIILGVYLKRKIFSFFLHAYTQNAVLHTLILSEMDYYTTQEQLQ